MEKWMQEYAKQLEIAVREHPEEYGWAKDPNMLPKVLEAMRGAFERRTFNKDSRAIKATCKALGIKHTYRDINRYFANFV